MALRIINISKTLEKLCISPKQIPAVSKKVLFDNDVPLTNIVPTRTKVTFFNKLPAEHLWKGVTSVSNAGKKRGRGKNVSKRNIKDLNRGQIIGVGKANMVWPGLTAPIIRGREIVEQQKLPEDPEREEKLNQLRNQMGVFKRQKLSPVERGWSGAKMPGRSIGPPDPIGEDTFDGFDTKVLELKTVFNMKGNYGRKRRASALVITGNGQGLVGFAIGKAIEPKAALRKAKNRAAQKLMHVETYENHTVYHDFFTQFGVTKIYVYQKPEGYGLVCHRAIKTICEVVGIKNIHCKVEGSTNVNHVLKTFLLGLLKQKTHKQIAEEKKLHLVEFRKETGYFPKVVASPSECRTKEEINKDEILDFERYCFDGKVVLRKKKPPPFFTRLPSYNTYLRKQENVRNQDKAKINLLVEYGEIRSFLADKYPECRAFKKPREVKDQDEESEQQ